MVASAKSWLANPGVERTSPILPWGAPAEVERVSPVTASARYLEHLRHAWDRKFPQHPLSEQELVLTLPASFDEVARELTIRAAQEAGLPKFVLVEEPQAAFYDFLSRHERALEAALGGAKLLLVVDVGGGTTDLTLIHAAFVDGQPKLTRIAVGDHLMLGGDNMDMLLARACEERLVGLHKLDATQWSMLVAAARDAKEQLLADDGPEKVTVAVVGRGSKLVGGTLKTELARDEVRERVVEGFFPQVARDAAPARAGRAAIQELGLPYASDAAISRHIVAFLRRHAGAVSEALNEPLNELPRPDAILLNGGVFNAKLLQTRLLEVVNAWFPGSPPVKLLAHDDLDLAVARGASWFGRVRRGEGVRIGGGSARAYFVGVEKDGQTQALCVVPRRQEEGLEVPLERTFALRLNEPVRFELFSSTGDAARAAGELLALGDELEPLPALQTVLGAPSGLQGQVPVRMVSRLSELGTLELFLVSNKGPNGSELRWKLEFQLRGAAAREGDTRVEPLPAKFEEGRELVERVYGKKPMPVSPRDVKDLFRNLERTLGPREGWSTAVCRELWSALHAGMGRRRRSDDHERVWCQLTGFTLRPGFGAPLDAWRAGETWKIFEPALQFHTETPNWTEWWVMWRRIAGGLDETAHRTIYASLAPHLRLPIPNAKPTKLKGVQPQGTEEMVRLAASLERLSAREKQELGELLLGRLDAVRAAKTTDAKPFAGASTLAWALGRLGARKPFFGSAHTVVAPDVAEAWLERILALDAAQVETAPFAAMMLARATGDRARDLAPELRERVAKRLEAARVPEPWLRAVREGAQLEQAEEVRVFGESLPAGLKLIG